MWMLVNQLSETFKSSLPEKHPLFQQASQLTPEGYQRIFASYESGMTRMQKIIDQDVLQIEPRITRGRRAGASIRNCPPI